MDYKYRITRELNDRMVIISPKRREDNYSCPDYTLFHILGAWEKAENYLNMYLDPKMKLLIKVPGSKYNVSPF